MNIYEKALQGLLDENDMPNFSSIIKFQSKKIKKENLQSLVEIGSDLGAALGTEFSAFMLEREVLEVGDKIVIVDEPIHFNRYRSQTLRHSLYTETELLWKIDDYKRFCRQQEPEALKGGLKKGLWTNQWAESIFGESSDAGDFFGNGSGGWKLIALQDVIFDIYCIENGIKLVRYPMQSSIMIKGRLENFGKLLLFGDKALRPLCYKLLMRTLGLTPIV